MAQCIALVAELKTDEASRVKQEELESLTAVHQSASGDSEKLVSMNEIGKQLGINRNTIRVLRMEGRFPKAIQVSDRKIMFRQSDITTWLEDGGALRR